MEAVDREELVQDDPGLVGNLGLVLGLLVVAARTRGLHGRHVQDGRVHRPVAGHAIGALLLLLGLDQVFEVIAAEVRLQELVVTLAAGVGDVPEVHGVVPSLFADLSAVRTLLVGDFGIPSVTIRAAHIVLLVDRELPVAKVVVELLVLDQEIRVAVAIHARVLRLRGRLRARRKRREERQEQREVAPGPGPECETGSAEALHPHVTLPSRWVRWATLPDARSEAPRRRSPSQPSPSA